MHSFMHLFFSVVNLAGKGKKYICRSTKFSVRRAWRDKAGLFPGSFLVFPVLGIKVFNFIRYFL